MTGYQHSLLALQGGFIDAEAVDLGLTVLLITKPFLKTVPYLPCFDL